VLQTTSGRGIDRTLPVWRLWQRAKKLGTWDPADVDLGRGVEGFVGCAMGQFPSRMARIERAQTTRTVELDADGGT
jgi:hypothetical protein